MLRPIRLGMVGGGNDAFIGSIHRIAARIDGEFELISGALSSTIEKSIASGKALGLSKDRNYGTFQDMAKCEAQLADGIEAVVIVTPNHMHFPVAREFLKRGIHVICDKPLTATLSDAKKMVAAVNKSDSLFILTHNYTGYPMVRQARELVKSGALGKLRLVQVEYVQDWLSEQVNNKQANWRTDPMLSGVGGSIGDIGTHAYNLYRFVTGLSLSQLSADLDAFVPGRRVDDNANVMMRFKGGAKGMLWCSQVALGNENGLRLRVFGEKGGVEWEQENPNQLWYTSSGEPKRLLTRGGAGTSLTANALNRIPAGHPEGYLEGFANIYTEAARSIRAVQAGQPVPKGVHCPDVMDGMEGIRFINACVNSSSRNSAWVSL
ncbi:Gfo/Idh/MocA family oxidoreductase [Amylibacter sp.]|nr:Gfo/Idh/MocA family oxidoreductase [Amylibacter sp.]